MNVPADEFIPTRQSLLSRLKDWEDGDSWKEFFDTYWRLIYSVALKAGLTESEAEEVVEETVMKCRQRSPLAKPLSFPDLSLTQPRPRSEFRG